MHHLRVPHKNLLRVKDFPFTCLSVCIPPPLSYEIKKEYDESSVASLAVVRVKEKKKNACGGCATGLEAMWLAGWLRARLCVCKCVCV